MLRRLFFMAILLPTLAVAAEDAGPKPPPWHLIDIWWDIGQDTAFESYIYSHENDENIFVGALRFPGENLVLARKLASFVEIYGQPIPVEQIPKLTVTFGNLRVNGTPVEKPSATAMYPKRVPDYAEALAQDGQVERLPAPASTCPRETCIVTTAPVQPGEAGCRPTLTRTPGATRLCWSDRSEHAVVRESLFVVQWVRIPPDQSPARQVGSQPCDDIGNDIGDA